MNGLDLLRKIVGSRADVETGIEILLPKAFFGDRRRVLQQRQLLSNFSNWSDMFWAVLQT